MTEPTATNITVLGAGTVGTNLAIRLAEAGHRITFGARDPHSDKVVQAVERISGAHVAPLAEAVAGAEFVVLAVPFDAIGSVLDNVGDLSDTILVDATNAVGAPLPDASSTVVDVITARRPEATVVKAFNTIGAEAYLTPEIDGHALFLPIAGPDAAAARVAELGAEMGFDALVIGDLDAIEMVEAFARLWIHLAFRVGQGRDFGFAKLHRTDEQ